MTMIFVTLLLACGLIAWIHWLYVRLEVAVSRIRRAEDSESRERRRASRLARWLEGVQRTLEGDPAWQAYRQGEPPALASARRAHGARAAHVPSVFSREHASPAVISVPVDNTFFWWEHGAGSPPPSESWPKP